MDINGSVAVVTGGASGLGEATVRNYVEGGGRVCIMDLQEEKGQALASTVPVLGMLPRYLAKADLWPWMVSTGLSRSI